MWLYLFQLKEKIEKAGQHLTPDTIKNNDYAKFMTTWWIRKSWYENLYHWRWGNKIDHLFTNMQYLSRNYKEKKYKKYGNNYTPKLKVNSSRCIQPIFSREAGLYYIVKVYVTVG